MAYQQNLVANGSDTQFTVTFPYLDEAHVYYQVDGGSAVQATFASTGIIEITPALTNGAALTIYRSTPTSGLITFVNGSRVPAADLNQAYLQALYVAEENAASPSPAGAMPVGTFQTVTPRWLSTGTAPTIGNGTLEGWYARFDDWVVFSARLVIGSTTNPGTGDYTFEPPSGLNVAADGNFVGQARVLNASIPNVETGVVTIADGASVMEVFTHDTAGAISASIPVGT